MKKVLVSLMMLGSLMATNLYATERPEKEQTLEKDRGNIITTLKNFIDALRPPEPEKFDPDKKN